jgi:hypothetical protein
VFISRGCQVTLPEVHRADGHVEQGGADCVGERGTRQPPRLGYGSRGWAIDVFWVMMMFFVLFFFFRILRSSISVHLMNKSEMGDAIVPILNLWKNGNVHTVLFLRFFFFFFFVVVVVVW